MSLVCMIVTEDLCVSFHQFEVALDILACKEVRIFRRDSILKAVYEYLGGFS